MDNASPDVKDGKKTVKWTVSSCKAGTVSQGTGWKYAWTGVTSTAATATGTVSKKGDVIEPSVKVTSPENASMNVTCTKVTAQNSAAPDYELTNLLPNEMNAYIDQAACKKSGDGYCITVPSGKTVTLSGSALSGSYIRCIHGYQVEAFSYTLSSGSTKKEYSTLPEGKNGIYWPQDNESLPVSSLSGGSFSVEITGATEVHCFVK